MGNDVPMNGRPTVAERGGATTMARVFGAGRILAGLVLFGLVIAACVREWTQVREVIAQLSPINLVASEILVLIGLFASVLTWRRLLEEVGRQVTVPEASKIYLVGQLGKYIPGSVWAFVVQMELAQRVGVRRLSSIAASTLTILFNLVVGLAFGAFAVPAVAQGDLWRYALLSALFLVAVVLLLPPVQRWVWSHLFRSHDGSSEGRRVSRRGAIVAIGWSAVSWLSYGAALAVLVVATAGATFDSVWLSVSGVALAMTAGFVIAVAPAGIGVREAVLVAALTQVVDPGRAFGVVLVLRLLFTLGDLLAAAATLPIRLAVRTSTPLSEHVGIERAPGTTL